MRLDNSTYRKLVEKAGLHSHESCCGDDRAGMMSGVHLALDALHIQIDKNNLYEDVSEEANRLWDKEHPDE